MQLNFSTFRYRIFNLWNSRGVLGACEAAGVDEPASTFSGSSAEHEIAAIGEAMKTSE
jgi:hypothetical protein